MTEVDGVEGVFKYVAGLDQTGIVHMITGVGGLIEIQALPGGEDVGGSFFSTTINAGVFLTHLKELDSSVIETRAFKGLPFSSYTMIVVRGYVSVRAESVI